MHSPEGISRFSSLIHAIRHPFRSPSQAAITPTDDSSSSDTASPLEILSDPSRSPEAAILSQAGYQMFCNNVQDGVLRSTPELSPKGFLSEFQDMIVGYETNGLLSFISAIANDVHKTNDDILKLYEEWNQDGVLDVRGARQFFQNIGSDLSRCSLSQEEEKLRRNLQNCSEQRKNYIEFIAEVLLLVYTHVYKPRDVLFGDGDEDLFRILIELKLLDSNVKEPEGKPRACFELYCMLTTKLYYRNEVATYLFFCRECKEDLKVAIERYNRNLPIQVYLAPVQIVIGFIRKLCTEEQEAVTSLFLKNLD